MREEREVRNESDGRGAARREVRNESDGPWIPAFAGMTGERERE